MVAALIFAFGIRWASFYAANQIDTDPEYIGVLYAIPVVASLLAIASLSHHKRLSVVSAMSDRISASWQRLSRRFGRSADPSAGGSA